MDYGMKNSRLRRQIDQLEAEKRRLILAKEISLSPSQIKKAAQRAGMMDPLPSDGELLTTTEPTRAKAVPAPPVIEKALVTKTAAVTPVPVRASVVLAKNDRSGKEARRTISAE